MVLVDTSIWIDHLRTGDADLRDLLIDGEIAAHPWVIGEIACGNLANRKEILSLLRSLPSSILVSDSDAHQLIEQRSLMGLGIGWVDVHLLASSLVSGHRLWTRDRKLLAAAKLLHASYTD